MPGFDLLTRRRVRLARYWKRGPRRVLDAGLGNGWFSYLAYRSGATVVAVSNEPSQVVKARQFYNDWLDVPEKGLSFGLMNFYQMDELESENFDEILCYEALEHVLEDQRVCSTFRRLLSNGGNLHLCCPNAEHPRWSSEPLDEKGEWGGHVRAGYTIASFRSLVEPLGFEMTASEGVGGRTISVADQFLQEVRGSVGDLVALPLALTLLPLARLDVSSPRVPYSVFARFRKSSGQQRR